MNKSHFRATIFWGMLSKNFLAFFFFSDIEKNIHFENFRLGFLCSVLLVNKSQLRAKIFWGRLSRIFLALLFVFGYWAKKFLLSRKKSSAIHSKQHPTCPEDKFKQHFWFEKLKLFHHLPNLSWKFSRSVERSFASFWKVQFWWLNQQLEEKVFFPETFSDQCHTLSK